MTLFGSIERRAHWALLHATGMADAGAADACWRTSMTHRATDDTCQEAELNAKKGKRTEGGDAGEDVVNRDEAHVELA